MLRPHIFVTAEKIVGLRSVAEVKHSISRGHPGQLWQRILAKAQIELEADALTPGSMFPGRSADQARHANRDYTVCHEAGQRILRAALVHLALGDAAFIDTALRQMEALFDPERWPEWRDLAHQGHGAPADLRTGMLSRDVALAYDWLHPALSEDQRQFIVKGLDRCGIQPFWRSVESGAWWAETMNNWLTCIVGGLGVAGMALGDDHPDSQKLIDFSLPRMRQYLEVYGPDGEFNESVAYGNATSLAVAYFLARRGFLEGGEEVLAEPPFPQACRWIMYLTLPPGRIAPFGDCKPGAPPQVQYFAPVASAAHDPVLQWFYLEHIGESDDPRLLLWYNPDLEPTPPDGVLPLGRAFPAHGGCVSNRTDWDPRAAATVVYGKAGREENHENDDVGQLCIDAYGESLIIDPGGPSMYPLDFFGATRARYYNASASGHNVPVVGGRESRHESGVILASAFDDERGAFWQLDLTPAYVGVRSVRRTVAHLFPGLVVVLDEVDLENAEPVSLRWHTVDHCAPDEAGNFVVRGEAAALAGRVLALDGGKFRFSRGQHEYRPPYNRTRLGDLLEQRRESYVEAQANCDSCRLLSLFAVFPPGHEPQPWRECEEGWEITTPTGLVQASATPSQLILSNQDTDQAWRVALADHVDS